MISTLPRSRAKALLATWDHPISLSMRARDHVHNILQGKVTRDRRQGKLPINVSYPNQGTTPDITIITSSTGCPLILVHPSPCSVAGSEIEKNI